jgi:hypothetical protein
VPSGFAAQRGDKPASASATVGNISSTGFYLTTPERWPLGELATLTIQLEGAPEEGPPSNFAIQALVVRHGEDGIGLSFVLPPGLNPALWEILIEKAATLTNQFSIGFMFRMLRTVLFFCRICGTEAEEPIQLLGGELDESRTETALEIAIGAERILAGEPEGASLRAHPGHIAHLVKFGSWAIGKLTKDLWSGLLATSCTPDGTDQSNRELVDLLVNVTPTQALIFVVSCDKAFDAMSAEEDHPSARVLFTPDEMKRLTGKTDLTRVATDIAYLFHAGLVDKNFDFTSYIPTENFDITPSRFGIDLFKRCKGRLADSESVMGKVEGA